MKNASLPFLVIVLTLATLNLRCSELLTEQSNNEVEPIADCQTGKHPISGSWLWLSTYGGISGETKTPESEGYTRKACFDADNTFAFYQADTVAREGTFTLTTDDSKEDSVTTIRFEFESEQRAIEQVVTFEGADTLILADQCYDCYVIAYKRIK